MSWDWDRNGSTQIADSDKNDNYTRHKKVAINLIQVNPVQVLYLLIPHYSAWYGKWRHILIPRPRVFWSLGWWPMNTRMASRLVSPKVCVNHTFCSVSYGWSQLTLSIWTGCKFGIMPSYHSIDTKGILTTHCALEGSSRERSWIMKDHGKSPTECKSRSSYCYCIVIWS